MRRILSEREERQHWKDFEATNEDRLKQQDQQYYDSQDFITVKWPSKEERERAEIEEAYELRQLWEQNKRRL